MKNRLLPLVMLSLVMNAYAYDIKVDGIYYNLSEEDHTASVVNNGNHPYKGEVIIPEKIEDEGGQEYTVTLIGEQAFLTCSELTSVKLPSTITSIGVRAFFNCSALVSVDIPSAVTSFGEGAFIYCSSLQSVEIPEGTAEVSENMFNGCSSLTSVTLPSTIVSIGNTAFAGCSALTTLDVKASVPPTCGTDVFANVDKDKCTLNITLGSEMIYKSAEEWKEFKNIEGKYAGVESVANGEISVLASDGCIKVNGAKDGQTVRIYNVNGQLLYSGSDTSVDTAAKGLYIVRVGDRIFKVVL